MEWKCIWALSVLALNRNRKGDHKTTAISSIAGGNAALVKFHDAFADGQTQAGTGAGFRSWCDLHEPLEDVVEPIGRHT
jgi:hypothetical protein